MYNVKKKKICLTELFMPANLQNVNIFSPQILSYLAFTLVHSELIPKSQTIHRCILHVKQDNKSKWKVPREVLVLDNVGLG